jgi:predicted dehydrogenase
VRRPGGVEVVAGSAAPADLYTDFVRACRGEGPSGPSGRDGRAALAVVLAAYRSHAARAFVQPE